MEWMILPFKRYADFTGRSRRMEYWMFFLLNSIVALVLLVPAVIGIFYAMVNIGQQGGASDREVVDLWFNNISPLVWVGFVLYIVYSLASFIPWLAVSVRRFHDKGISRWVFVALFLGSFVFGPLGFAIYILAALPGDQVTNKYGADPLDPYDEDIFA